MSNRIQKASTIITTNLTFDRWEKIFKDSILTAAIIDLSGQSYRALEALKWAQSNQ